MVHWKAELSAESGAIHEYGTAGASGATKSPMFSGGRAAPRFRFDPAGPWAAAHGPRTSGTSSFGKRSAIKRSISSQVLWLAAVSSSAAFSGVRWDARAYTPAR